MISWLKIVIVFVYCGDENNTTSVSLSYLQSLNTLMKQPLMYFLCTLLNLLLLLLYFWQVWGGIIFAWRTRIFILMLLLLGLILMTSLFLLPLFIDRALASRWFALISSFFQAVYRAKLEAIVGAIFAVYEQIISTLLILAERLSCIVHDLVLRDKVRRAIALSRRASRGVIGGTDGIVITCLILRPFRWVLLGRDKLWSVDDSHVVLRGFLQPLCRGEHCLVLVL